MSRSTRLKESVFAVVRYDMEAPEPHLGVTVKEVVRSLELAEAEVKRLNLINADKGCTYFWQATRLFAAGQSAGTDLRRE